ncbi:septal ring lytic transglycosylase RlpA family protein [Rubrobacter calidifluminis]|uniref:septal ring lytic transglycosylase RlpA family protein n=1 Tax=Rubrobacter calidifluminis TaxID=1392640 RepID=UPI0023602611|nr:septal ring lytic transglycosylase RlpA family protein [Rubrobacter calidifluminis]
MKSLLKMLFVAGVLALSVAFVQKDAQAEPLVASWYGPGFQGALTASGQPFNMYDYTAASPYLPFGTKLRVCYDGCVVVTVNDRGPYVAGRQLDLSYAAAQAIGLYGVGTVDATIVGSGSGYYSPYYYGYGYY